MDLELSWKLRPQPACRAATAAGYVATNDDVAGPAGTAGVDGIGATAEELKATLLIEGDAVGTHNKQELYNKTTDGGYF